VPFGVDSDGGEDSRRRELLALPEVRRDLERLAVAIEPLGRESMAVTRAAAIRHLQELIAALDRRVPRVERVGEAAIARDAETLKARALKRIKELERLEGLKAKG
jgi:hypothetical protein